MDLSWVWGVRGGQIFFCYELWTHWDPLGVRPAPKSICAHQTHPLKLLPRKNGQNPTFWPVWKGPAKRPEVPSEVQIRFQSINLGQKNPFYGPICTKLAFGDFGGKSKFSVFGPSDCFSPDLVKRVPGPTNRKFRFFVKVSKCKYGAYSSIKWILLTQIDPRKAKLGIRMCLGEVAGKPRNFKIWRKKIFFEKCKNPFRACVCLLCAHTMAHRKHPKKYPWGSIGL